MTPPELLGVRNFAGDHFKVEAFAMGYLMYFVTYGLYPAWQKIPNTYYSSNCPLGDIVNTLRGKLFSEINAFVRSVLDPIQIKIKNRQVLSEEEDYMRVLGSLLEPDPVNRMTVRQAKEALGKRLKTRASST